MMIGGIDIEPKNFVDDIAAIIKEIRILRKFCERVIVASITNSGLSTDLKLDKLSKKIDSLNELVNNGNQQVDKLIKVASPLIKEQVTWDGAQIYEKKKVMSWTQMEMASGIKACTLRKRYEKYVKQIRERLIDTTND